MRPLPVLTDLQRRCSHPDEDFVDQGDRACHRSRHELSRDGMDLNRHHRVHRTSFRVETGADLQQVAASPTWVWGHDEA
jgi:hypothetical protein